MFYLPRASLSSQGERGSEATTRLLNISCGPSDPTFPRPEAHLAKYALSYSLLTLNSLCHPPTQPSCLGSPVSEAWQGRQRHKGMGVLPHPHPPWFPGAEGFLVSSLEQGTKPSPAWPQSGHSWECVSLDTGWCGGACAISVCLCNWTLFTNLRICLCLRGLCILVFICVFPCVYRPM